MDDSMSPKLEGKYLRWFWHMILPPRKSYWPCLFSLLELVSACGIAVALFLEVMTLRSLTAIFHWLFDIEILGDIGYNGFWMQIYNLRLIPMIVCVWLIQRAVKRI